MNVIRKMESKPTLPSETNTQLAVVSVIIPVFNRADFIEQTIRSVLDQTYANIELIVVDDGSTDNSKALIESFLPDLKLLTHQGGINKGQSASINLALQHIQGEFVAILDSDDFWEPEKIEAQVGFLNQNPELGLVYVNGNVVDEKGERLHAFYGPGHHREHTAESYLQDCYFLFPNNSLVRSSILLEAGFFDESLRAAQDHDMGVRIAELTKFDYLDRTLFNYRKHQNSISGSHTLVMWEDGFKILEKASQRYEYSSQVIRHRKAVLHFRIAQCHAESKKWHLAFWHAIQSALFNPRRTMHVLLGKEKVTPPR